MLPRPLSRPLGRMVRLPSNGELARTRTTASGRSRSRLTRHGARDDTRCKSCDISMQRSRTNALALVPSCTGLRSGSAPTPRSRSPPALTTYARLQPILPTAELQAPRAAQKENDNFTKGNHRAQETWGHLPSRRALASAQCPHAPVTLHYRTCGRCRDALPGHYLCFCSDDKCNNALLHRAGGVINPVGPEAHPCAGAPPPSTEPC